MRPLFLFNDPEGNPIKLKTVSNEVLLYISCGDAELIIVRLNGYKKNIKIGYNYIKNELKNSPYNIFSDNFKNELDMLAHQNIIKDYYLNTQLLKH